MHLYDPGVFKQYEPAGHLCWLFPHSSISVRKLLNNHGIEKYSLFTRTDALLLLKIGTFDAVPNRTLIRIIDRIQKLPCTKNEVFH